MNLLWGRTDFPQIQTVGSLLALIALFPFLLWKSNLGVIQRKAPRQSFSRSFGIRGVLWKSLGASMDQKLDNSPTSLQLLNLSTSSNPFQIQYVWMFRCLDVASKSNFIESPTFPAFNQDWPPPPKISIKVINLYYTKSQSIAKILTPFFVTFCFTILSHIIPFFDIELFLFNF